MSGYLSLSDGSHVPVVHDFVIGRVAGCGLVIDDTKASRRHARIVVENDVVEIEDLDSSNGTLLNGKPVTRRLLRSGDRVTIGKTEFTYHEGPLPGAGPVARADGAGSPFADDDVDLFGEPTPAPAATDAAAAPPPPVARPVPAPPPVAPPPPVRSVVEFADEVVEVRRPAPPPAAAAKPASASAPAPAAPGGRILQYNKVAGGGGVLGDDLSQLGGGQRLLFVLAALAVGAGIVYGIVHLTR